MHKYMTIIAIPLATLALAGCQQEASAPAAEQASRDTLSQLPVSTNAAMVGLIDQSADYIWALGNGDMPKDDHDWHLVRGAVYDMILGGAVMKVPGTGEFDAQWTAEDNWQQWSDELTQIGQDALPLAESRSTDIEAWRAIGDRLVDNCLQCHEAFKPEVPSQGVLHESTERESRGISIFD
jgi:hypothetical protein